jgi:hypothetical protein
MLIRTLLAVLFGLAITVGAAFYTNTVTADGAISLNTDALASVVAIEAGGKPVGTGVVVTGSGIVVTSYDIALMYIKDGKRIVVKSIMPRTATLVAIDAKNGLAAFQMYGVIPPYSKVGYTLSPKDGLTVCAPSDVPTKNLRAPNGGVCAVFTRQGKLIGVTLAGPEKQADFIGNRILNELIKP